MLFKMHVSYSIIDRCCKLPTAWSTVLPDFKEIYVQSFTFETF